jgi:proprotein convertase subtilisin/kexin type 5
MCAECHPTCHSGCMDDRACSGCHFDCNTCSGPNETQCTSCWEGGYLASINSASGSACQCGSNYTGPASNCRPKCQDRNCGTCRFVQDTEQCLGCVEGWKLDASSKCVACAFGEICNNTVSHLAAEVPGCRFGTWYDSYTCVGCRDGCLICDGQDSCVSCQPGYLFAKGSRECMSYCSTGFLATGTALTCQGPEGKVADFEFVDATRKEEGLEWEFS